MGAAPFHFWFPEIIEGLRWINCLIILTWQKIAPIILIIYNAILNEFFTFIILLSIIIRGIIGFNQIRIRKILTFSSINHIAWIIRAIINSKIIWIIYFIIYSFITINLIYILNKFNIIYINQLISIINNKFILKIFFCLNFLSLGGLPPFIGFLPKWLIINELIQENNFLLRFSIIIFTLLTLYFYIRIIFSSLIININSQLNFNFKIRKFFILNFNFIILSRIILFPILYNHF